MATVKELKKALENFSDDLEIIVVANTNNEGGILCKLDIDYISKENITVKEINYSGFGISTSFSTKDRLLLGADEI